MANILLIEPDYKCKYPPLGLMKISYYHKEFRNDNVWFVKGKLPNRISETVVNKLKGSKYYIDKFENIDEHIESVNEIIKNGKWDRVYVTTLFTYEFDKVVESLEYAKSLVGKDKVYTGGILATLMPKEIEKVTGIKPQAGQLTDSIMVDYDDKVNIDILTPDYSILDNVEYKYENDNAYYAYTTRGCGMNCGFCAVKTLEPEYKNYISIYSQIQNINKLYGPKKDLLLMDNNVLKSPMFPKIIEDIKELGFQKGATYKNPKTGKDNNRYVDFNQGLDALLFTEEKTKLLSEIAIRPVRIAFDHIEDKKIYEKAIRMSAKYGITHLSNYILYNADEFVCKGKTYSADTPEDLYERLEVNVRLQEELRNEYKLDGEQFHIFSFPMRYIPLSDKQRGYVGTHWNEKYLRAVQRILIPTQGKGVSSKSFFYRAFGENKQEFIKILLLPEDYIATRGEPSKIKNISDEELAEREAVYRFWNSLRNEVYRLYDSMTDDEFHEFIKIVSVNSFNPKPNGSNKKSDYNGYKVMLISKNEKIIKALAHYYSESGLIELLKMLKFNRETYTYNILVNYLSRECKLLYDKLIKYITDGRSVNLIKDFVKIFGIEAESEIYLYIMKNKSFNNSIEDYFRKYSFKFNVADYYVLKWSIMLDLFSYDEQIKILGMIHSNNEQQLKITLQKLTQKILTVIDREYRELDKKLVDEIRNSLCEQLSFFWGETK